MSAPPFGKPSGTGRPIPRRWRERAPFATSNAGIPRRAAEAGPPLARLGEARA